MTNHTILITHQEIYSRNIEGYHRGAPPLQNVARLFTSKERSMCFHRKRTSIWYGSNYRSGNLGIDLRMWEPDQYKPYPKGRDQRLTQPHD